MSENRISNFENQLYHAIIIPSYKEEEEVLLQTLNIVAKNSNAKTQFIIFLAM